MPLEGKVNDSLIYDGLSLDIIITAAVHSVMESFLRFPLFRRSYKKLLWGFFSFFFFGLTLSHEAKVTLASPALNLFLILHPLRLQPLQQTHSRMCISQHLAGKSGTHYSSGVTSPHSVCYSARLLTVALPWCIVDSV